MEVLSRQKIVELASPHFAPGYSIVTVSPSENTAFSSGRFAGPESPEVTTHTIYDLASITKLFTSAIVLRLHEAGQLSIYDRCSEYLDNFRESDLQLIDLMTHRAGFWASLADYRSKYKDKESLLGALMVREPTKHAADHIDYASLQFIYLGVIAERVSGSSLQQLMHRLFNDLALRETYTGIDIADAHIPTPPTESIGSAAIQGVVHDETARLLGGLAGHAGIFASAADLAKFGKAWLSDAIIQSESLRSAVFCNYDPSGLNPQAIGWWLRYPVPETGVQSTPGVFSHIGFTGSLVAINPAAERVCAFTCNRTYYGRDNREHRKVWSLIMEWIAGTASESQTEIIQSVSGQTSC